MWRDWRSGETRLLAAALALTVAAVTAVGFFTDRVSQALHRQGNELIAADLVVESSQPPAAELRHKASELGLRSADTLEFPSVVLTAEAPQLVEVKAVSEAYPLRGELRVRASPSTEETPLALGPQTREVWVEPRLLLLLGAAVGDKLRLGEAEFSIGQALSYEPDRGGGLFQLAPRVLLPIAALAETGLITPASRVRYRLLLAGDATAVERYRDWLQPRLSPGVRLIDPQEARPEFGAAIDRASRFLSLATLVTLLVAGAAIALASRRLVERQTDAVAIMRCLGAPRRLLLQVFLLRLLLFSLIAGLAGCLLGFLAQFGLASLVGHWFAERLPPPSAKPLVVGLGVGLITLLGFAAPPLLHLARVPPLRALRRDLGTPPASEWVAVLIASTALLGLIYWQAGDRELAVTLMLGVAATLGLLGLLGYLLVLGAAWLQPRTSGVARLGLATLARRRGGTLLQILGFGVGILALLLLAIVRVDLLRTWQQSLPADAPNRFLVNIQPDQIQPLREFLAEQGVAGAEIMPMIRGRLLRVNEREVRPEDYADPRAERLAAREFNLSWATLLQNDNRILAGEWWGERPAPAPAFSVEKGLAETLGIRLGDRLTFSVVGTEISAPVTSLRTVQWDSFNVNFFVVGTPGLLAGLPATSITSFYLPPSRDAVTAKLIREFPNLTLLDVDAIMRQVRTLVDRGVLAVEYVFLFTVLAGVLVMVAGIHTHFEERMASIGTLRTLGARRNRLLVAVAVEFTALGLLSGLLASLFAEATGEVLARQLFGLAFELNPLLWVAGVLGSAVAVGLTGTLAVYPLLSRPPLRALSRG